MAQRLGWRHPVVPAALCLAGVVLAAGFLATGRRTRPAALLQRDGVPAALAGGKDAAAAETLEGAVEAGRDLVSAMDQRSAPSAAESSRAAHQQLTAYFDSLGTHRPRAARHKHAVRQLKREVRSLRQELASTASADAQQMAALKKQVAAFGDQVVSSLKHAVADGQARSREGTERARTVCECTTAECSECPDSDYSARPMHRARPGDAGAKPQPSDPQRAQLQQHQSVEQMETSTEERISALQKRLGALQHLAGGRDESAPHYYVTGEYGNKYDEVFNKLFAPGDPTPIHARGGLFESPDAHPLPGKRMITRIHKIQLSGNITCTNCFFLGQNSKVVINNWAGNATDIGDEEEASIFDDAESLEQPSRGQQLRIVPHHKSLQSRLRDEHLLKMQRARVRARVLRARREAAAERSEGVRERKEDSLERAQRAARTLAAAEAKAGEDALKQQSRAERGKQDKFTKLQRVEMSTRALTRAEKAVATSNDILKLRLAALHSTEQLFQVPLPLSLRSALVDA